MEEPPLIDVEPADSKSKPSGCGGCLGKLIPVVAGLLLLLIVLMGLAVFMWGKDSESKDESAGAGVESVEVEKKGVAGLLEKVKRAVKGEKSTPVTGGASAGSDASSGEVVPNKANEKASEEEDKMLKGKASGQEEGEVAESNGQEVNSGEGEAQPKAIKRRGGSFGSSTGSAIAGGANGSYQIWRGNFSTSGSDLEFEIIYKEAGGQLQFRCFVMPYDSQTAKFFRSDKGDLFLSFNDQNAKQLVPAGQAFPLPLTKMTAFESKGQVLGWVARGIIPLDSQEISSLDSAKLAWDFDKELGDWLKELKKNRGR